MKKKILGILIFVLATIGVGVLNIKNTYAEEAWSINIGSEYRKDTELTGFNDQQPKEYTYSIGTLKKDAKGKFSWKNSSNDHVITGKLDSSKKNLIITVDYNKVKCSKVYKVAYPNCEKTINNKKQSLTYSVPLKKSEKKMAKSLKDVLSGKEIKIRAVSTSSKTLGSVKEIHTFRFNEKSLGIVDILNVSDTKKTNNKTDSTEETCMNSDGAKSLGWIVCPIMDWMNDASNKLYDDYVKPALEVQPKLFTGTSGDNTWDGWDTFRNIANTLMIILFLFVIFSQLTGVGIDNYGIKKILPKLITAAILMNLSYWICVILIDTSNIFGNGLQGIFDGLAANLDGLNVGIESKQAELGTEAGALVSAGVISTLFSGGIMVWSNPAILLTLFISLLGVMVSIFFLFIILAVREAAIVVLVVLSPLAVACMMLPNTKSWFDKWWKFFGSLLMVYPIAGVLVGGGNYVSKLLLSAGTGTFWTFTAMLAGIVPIFFIPTVLRNSLSMAGNLGAKISGIGARVGGGVQRGAANFPAAKYASRLGANREQRLMGDRFERRTQRMAGVRKDENGNWVADESIGRVGRFMRGGNAGMGRARTQFISDQKANDMRDRLTDGGGVAFDAAMVEQSKANAGAMTDSYMALIKSQTRNGDDSAAFNDLFKRFSEENDGAGNASALTAMARLAGRRKDTAAAFSKMLTNGEYKYTDSQGVEQTQAVAISGDMRRAMAKEITTGENSGNYRAASPIQYEYMSQVNSGAADPGISYSEWSGDARNVGNALNHHVTNSQELQGMKGSSLEELSKMMNNGTVSAADSARIQGMARELLANKNKPGAPAFDTTKEAQITKIANWHGPMPQQAGPHPINNSGPGNGGPGVINIPH